MNTEIDALEALKELASRLRLKDATEIRKIHFVKNSVLGMFIIPLRYVPDFVVTVEVMVMKKEVHVISMTFRHRNDIHTLESKEFYNFHPEWFKDVIPMLTNVEYSDISYHSLNRVADSAQMILSISGDNS